MKDTQHVVEALLTAYRAIAIEMAELPIVNPRLSVDALAFREWNGGHAGIVVTPWFMNVVIVLPEGSATVEPGTRVARAFPAGQLEFVTSVLDGVGPIEGCSLFSPMGQFRDMSHALEVARDAAAALFTAPVVATPPAPAVDAPPAKTEAAPSRRDLFRRAFSLG
ncbi:MAG: [NiFe]-hydrogenase assembly chaperone HybE [Archangiaceae bacterium]|nr:[NiFe]-hydrogenase assembly chaperone HybE [Archangiaceae bacterium]